MKHEKDEQINLLDIENKEIKDLMAQLLMKIKKDLLGSLQE